MSAYNEFRFMGRCYGDARKVITTNSTQDNPRYYTNIVLVVKSHRVKREPNYIPITATGDLAEKASLQCRNGNKVAICGEIITHNTVDYSTGEMTVRTFFLANDIMLIEKAKRVKLSTKKIVDLVETASIDEFEAPKSRQKG